MVTKYIIMVKTKSRPYWEPLGAFPHDHPTDAKNTADEVIRLVECTHACVRKHQYQSDGSVVDMGVSYHAEKPSKVPAPRVIRS